MDRAVAMARTTLRTVQLAKRQRTWFRHRGKARPVAAEGAADAILHVIRSL
jgi:tRNA A37 N6-isopentenylltransferase MiaA